MNTSDTDIAQKILRGSHNIDRMRSEIKQLVKMVLGLVEKHLLEHVLQQNAGVVTWRADLKGDNCSGKNWFARGEIDTNKPQKSCYHVTYWQGSVELAYSLDISGANSYEALETKNVVKVYRALSEFVTSMVRCYPDLESTLSPFIEAADAL